jgi:putative heme-binding domain-containing protein
LASLTGPEIVPFCRTEYARPANPDFKGAILKTLAAQTSDPADAPILFEGLTWRQMEVVRACAVALSRIRPAIAEGRAQTIIGRLGENNELCKTLDPLLAGLTGAKPAPLPARLSEKDRASRVGFWRGWYKDQFKETFVPKTASGEKSDAELIEFLLSDRLKGGNRERGAQIYETLQCNSCHGGGVTPGREGRIFGPDLAGVTRRLSPREFAESLVYPSKQVADRFKAYEIALANDTILSGFITEQNDTTVTVVDRDQVHRLPRSEIRSIRPQSTSLMPDHLLNALAWEQIRDLVAFVDEKPPAR